MVRYNETETKAVERRIKLPVPSKVSLRGTTVLQDCPAPRRQFMREQFNFVAEEIYRPPSGGSPLSWPIYECDGGIRRKDVLAAVGREITAGEIR